MLTVIILVMLSAIRISPHVGQAPLKVDISAYPDRSGYFCIEADGEEGGWQRTCTQIDRSQRPVWVTWMVLEHDSWTVRLRRGEMGEILGAAHVDVLASGADGVEP